MTAGYRLALIITILALCCALGALASERRYRLAAFLGAAGGALAGLYAWGGA